MFDADFHIHTKHSFDSFLDPKIVCKLASKRRLSVIAITDHNTIKGSLVTVREASAYKNLAAVPGIEIKTNLGDLIGLFIQDEINSRDYYEVVDEIRAQDGLVVLPHPYKKHKGIIENIAKTADVIEGRNGRTSYKKNTEASILSENINKPVVAGSDAHFAFELGRIKTRFHSDFGCIEDLRKIIFNSERDLIGNESPFVVHGFSFVTEIIKKMLTL